MTIWPDMPDCGVYLVWPSDGVEWIHPEDIESASKWIPSNRVFRRTNFDGTYYELHYGEKSIRVKPTMWHRVTDEGFSVGERVEVLGKFLENEPCLGRITEIRFDKPTNRILYTIESRDLPLPRPFVLGDFVTLDKKSELREAESAPPLATMSEVPGIDWLTLEE